MHLSIFLTAYQGASYDVLGDFSTQPLFGFVDNIRFLTATSDAILLQQLGLEHCPLASLLQQAEPDTRPISDMILLAQPVYLQLQTDSFALTEILQLQTTEYQTLTTLFNTHFEADKIRFLPSQSQQHWYVQLPQSWQLQTYAAQSAMHLDIKQRQPSGADAGQWLSMMNEIQMLLHQHAINQQREQQGQFPINSLWLSGEGALTPPTTEDIAMTGEGDLYHALQHWYLDQHHDDLASLIAAKPSQAMALYTSLSAVDWDQLLQQLRKRAIQQLTIYCPFQHGCLQIDVNSWDSWKLWRPYTQSFQSILEKQLYAN